jgi:hypothetical protein
VFQFGFSQTEKLIQGIILCNDLPLKGIEVVNLVTEKSITTDVAGRFTTLVKVNDILVLVSEKYEQKKVFLDKEFLDQNNFTIFLIRKTEELDEVKVISKPTFIKIKFDKNIASQLTIEKDAINRKPIGVHDGTIENGAGLTLPIGRGKKKLHQIDFKELVNKTYAEKYYIEILKLKPYEFDLFIDFCDADPNSKSVLKNSNELKILDFLLIKNIEFKKLNPFEKIK